jgi:hypothetical protein
MVLDLLSHAPTDRMPRCAFWEGAEADSPVVPVRIYHAEHFASAFGASEAAFLLENERSRMQLWRGPCRMVCETRLTMTPGSAKINWRNLLHFLIPARGHDRRRLRPYLNHVLH